MYIEETNCKVKVGTMLGQSEQVTHCCILWYSACTFGLALACLFSICPITCNPC